MRVKTTLLAVAMAACAFHPSNAQWGTDIVNNEINWELQVWQSDYTGSEDGDGLADPTIITECFLNGITLGSGCKSWDCAPPCFNETQGPWWSDIGTSYTASLALYSVAFESDGADDCVYEESNDDHYWAGYLTLRDGLTDMPIIYPSSDFVPCQWTPWLGNGTTWLMPNSEQFDQRMELTWRYTAGGFPYEALDFGTVAMNTTKADVNSNRNVTGQYGSAPLRYFDILGDGSRDVFYKFNITQASRVTISTDHPLTNFDTKVYLSDLAGREFAMDNDGGSGNTSALVAQLPSGTYGIRVEGNGGSNGTFRLSVVVQAPQGQPGVPIADNTSQQDYLSFNIVGAPGTCNPQAGYHYSVLNSSTAWGSSSGTDPNLYFQLSCGAGPQSFAADVHWGRRDDNVDGIHPCAVPNWQVLIDGQVCTSCVVNVTELQRTDCLLSFDGQGYYGGYGTDRITVTHQAGDAWDRPDRALEFALRDLNTNVDIRFKAVMVGTSFTSVLGYFDAPQAPLFILRDPPGDRSYSSMINSQEACLGQTFSVSTDESAGFWARARMGTEGSVGVIVETDYEIYGELGVDLTAGRTETSDKEYQTCVETTTEFSTGNGDLEEGEDIPGDDVFIGSAVRYAYGVAKTVARDGCATSRDATLEIVPMELISSYNYTESYIRNLVIPELQGFLAQLEEGTPQYRDVANQLDVWDQTLTMNDAIKANAPLEINRAFNGGGNGQTYSITTTTDTAFTIEMSAYLDAGISAEFGAFMGGSGLAAGGELRMRQEFGKGPTGSNATTNTMSYHLEDGNGSDNFNVEVRKDAFFGTYAFRLDENVSATSCPYEGGYALDQPELFAGSSGNTTMVLEEVPLGTQAVFPLFVCNNSDRSRTYFLKFNASTNTEGGILNVFGNALNSNDDGVQLVVPAGECLPMTNLTLTQPNLGAIDFTDIELYLYSLCEPDLRSTVTISAYFGDGNVPTGIAGEAASAAAWFSLQPNPSNGLFELRPTADIGSATITVFDGVGRVVKPSFRVVGKGTTVIDLQDLPPGAYHLMAEQAGESRMHKLLVQR